MDIMYRDEIKKILKDIKGDYFDFENGLITNRYLNSFDVMKLLVCLERAFEIKIPTNAITLENLDSLDELIRLVDKYKS